MLLTYAGLCEPRGLLPVHLVEPRAGVEIWTHAIQQRAAVAALVILEIVFEVRNRHPIGRVRIDVDVKAAEIQSQS